MVRTDLSEDAAWRSLCDAVTLGGGEWPVLFVDDAHWMGATAEEVRAAAATEGHLDVVFLADSEALTDPEHKLLAVAGPSEPELRVVPGWVMLLHGTVAVTGMSFGEFAAVADPAGVFRGFPD
ncbi:hypothetical protein M1L60_33530 [Actinoplanes sp. TRM 88003]|uniref:DUF6924 domain-containing protein n=1 Tax=Paractinoplanes aksuensis TaxID=2939490 RepID=A0ABT1DXA6_9ACTN|nr:hypothetical protein [Actinoplanes aksuensis]MCO8275517.1 hypothetical protein [Actinoplanes aksuensis]